MGGKKRKLDLFQCIPLDCVLTKTACAERHMRANLAKRNENGHWVPDAWAIFISPCRDCKIGKRNLKKAKLPPPPQVRRNKPRWGNRKEG